MVLLTCQVKIKSKLCLEDVAQIVSDCLLGGVGFIGREEHVRDEVPAVYTARCVLGCRFILFGEPDDEGYFLEVWHYETSSALTAEQIRESLVDISADIVALLSEIESIQVSI
jgi:hypothetical protein